MITMRDKEHREHYPPEDTFMDKVDGCSDLKVVQLPWGEAYKASFEIEPYLLEIFTRKDVPEQIAVVFKDGVEFVKKQDIQSPEDEDMVIAETIALAKKCWNIIEEGYDE